ncbi:MAG: fimbrillin family protein [Bacteroidales bacterium]|nr:fimbrillin family protein [Bacteroidales bacterium]
MKRLGYIIAAGLLCTFSSCQKGAVENVGNVGRHTIGFCIGEASTRTMMNPDGLTASWEKGDRIAVWAKNSSGEYTLNNTQFSVYGADGARAFFTATIDASMPEDRYTYFAAYPVPESVSLTKATFTIPSVQDGKVSGGADIMIANPLLHGPLEEVKELSDYTRLGMSMEHLLHQFRFYLPEGEDKLGGEAIVKMVLTFPKPVAGKLVADFTDTEAAAEFSGEEKSITLKLSEPLVNSTSSERKYAMAAFFPSSFEASESINIKIYTETKIANAYPVNLEGRTFAAGHSTPVRLRISDIREYGRLRFTVSSNNLGENANAVRLTAPQGCTWGDGSTIYEYRPGHEITTGETFEIPFENLDTFRTFSGKDVTVTFDTEHVDATQTVRVPDLTTLNFAEISAGLPYLLYEDFSGVESFNSGDNYAMSNAGSKSPKSFLNGWTGGRVGAEAGMCIRIACRRETSIGYDARVDSAPIISLKKSTDIKVSYDYGVNNKYGGIAIITDGNVGQNVYIGYVTDTKGYSSGDDSGTFESDNTFYAKEYTGSYTSTPNSDTRIIHSAPTGVLRITWRSAAEYQAGTTNTTCWLYLDNIKVQIAK